MKSYNSPFIVLVFLLIICSLNDLIGQKNWTKDLPGIGTFSSPRVTDLNNDGTKDIIFGAGRLEFQKCDSAVIAIDGLTGDLLWNVSAIDQIFGSPTLYDITGDSIDDIFIGGRSAEFIAIDGKSGEELWRFNKINNDSTRWFNFYNAQLVNDTDQDGFQDLLVSNGGDVLVEPYDSDRPPGYLVVISSKTGKVLHQARMPDERETYLSPIIDKSESTQHKVIYGSGGETVGGGLFISYLDDLINEDLSQAICLDSSESKGYIGPPVLVDINGDSKTDIISNSVDGRMIAFDGNSYEKIWEVNLPNTESYSSLTIGNFNGDKTPDLFVSYGQGIWPNLDWSIQIMVNGLTGQIEYQDSLGFYQNTTPLAVDLNGDGLDEIIMSLNFQEVNEFYQKYFYNSLIAIEFKSKEIIQITNTLEGSNLSSTPWIGDLDNNGFLDIIFTHGVNLRHTYTFDGIRLHRMDTQIPVTKKIKWGSYQGSNYDGVYNPD